MNQFRSFACNGASEIFALKMMLENLPDAAIDTFIRFYKQLANGSGAFIAESDLNPVRPDEIQEMDQLQQYVGEGLEAIKRTVIIKLNGGLGTTMGLLGPKSLIATKNELSFLAVCIGQAECLGKHLGLGIPLVFMNSFFTETETRRALESNPGATELPVRTFLQHKFPKVLAATLEPVSFPDKKSLEWNPAGHGDLLISLETSGLLRRFLDDGYRYVFVSNIDNLSAQIDFGILGYFQKMRLDFLMEVTERTPMDRKGGHLARLKNGRLILREASQCKDGDSSFFTDILRHRFFNTNSLWINLEAVKEAIESKKYADSPFIINKKKLDPRDSVSPDVYQLESALGSAITLFEQSAAVKVPRSRFTPVKNCEDILLLWSDFYSLDDQFRIDANSACSSSRPLISLDPFVYSNIDSLRKRFPFGAPSLVDCESLTISGDVKFGRNVALRGSVSILNKGFHQVTIEDNSDIRDDNLVFS